MVSLSVARVQQQKYDRLAYLLLKLFTVFTLTVLLNCIIDYYFYGELVFPIFRFLKFNFTSPLSNFYGVSPWHFHITQSVPITLGLSTPLFVYGLFAPSSKGRNIQASLLIRCYKSNSLYLPYCSLYLTRHTKNLGLSIHYSHFLRQSLH